MKNLLISLAVLIIGVCSPVFIQAQSFDLSFDDLKKINSVQAYTKIMLENPFIKWDLYPSDNASHHLDINGPGFLYPPLVFSTKFSTKGVTAVYYPAAPPTSKWSTYTSGLIPGRFVIRFNLKNHRADFDRIVDEIKNNCSFKEIVDDKLFYSCPSSSYPGMITYYNTDDGYGVIKNQGATKVYYSDYTDGKHLKTNTLFSEVTFKGLEVDYLKMYKDNGKLYCEGRMMGGLRIGEWKVYNTRTESDNNELYKEMNFSIRGQSKYGERFIPDEFPYNSYGPENAPYFDEYDSYSVLSGELIYYHSNGEVHFEGSFNHWGESEGIITKYYNNGQVMWQGHATIEYSPSDHELLYFSDYQICSIDDELQTNYFNNGEIKSEVSFKDCNYHGVCKFYEDNAIIDNGTYLKQEVNYIDGVIDWQKCYDESGNKIPCD